MLTNYSSWPLLRASLALPQLDRSRRWLGKLLDAVGLGPVETPFRVAFSEPGVTLRSYGGDQSASPVLLMIPAPIKSASLWDLSPSVSVVQHCLRSRLRVYLLQWEPPGKQERDFGLAEYADRLILDCLDAISAETGQRRVFLAGHSLGGTFAALFGALHPGRVKGLIGLGAPLHFGPQAGILGSLVAATPRASSLTAALGNVPGSFLSGAALMAAPVTFGWSRWLDWIESLPDGHSWPTHLRVERWTFEEMPMAQRLFEEVVELLYREDRFMKGTLRVGGRRAAPELVSAPVLSVVDRRCQLVPPQAVEPFHHAVRSPDTELLWYEGDAGVSLQHVGMLVGRQAHKHLWPAVIRWSYAHWYEQLN